MFKGILIHAFGDELIDYYKLANTAARLATHFLKLPVACITDAPNKIMGIKNIIEVESKTKQQRTLVGDKYQYKNDTRTLSYELIPFDQTLLIDSDYLIFNSELLKWFETDYNFACPLQMNYPGSPPKYYHIYNNIVQAWATVIYFNKSKQSEFIFDYWKLIQDNYEYYGSLLTTYGIYRNDYSLSLALHVMNGYKQPAVEMPSLLTIPISTPILDITDDSSFIVAANNKEKFIKLKNMNLHIMNKRELCEILKTKSVI